MSYVTYHSLKALNCKVNIADIEHLDVINYSVKANFPDIKVTTNNTSYTPSILHNRCLFVTNGYIYPSTMIDGEIYIPKASISMLRSKENEIGILDFNKFNVDLIKYQLTRNMLFIDTQHSAYNRVTITTPADVQFPILSIGGYMVFEDNESFYRISDRSFVLNLDKLGYINKLFELNRYRDIFNELGVPTVNGGFGYNMADLGHDTTILNILTLHNSMLINVPVNNLTVNKIYLDHSEIPGNFRTEISYQYPVMLSGGKIGNYFRRKNNDTKYTIYLNAAYTNNLVSNTNRYTPPIVHNDHRVVGNTYNLDSPYFLNISN